MNRDTRKRYRTVAQVATLALLAIPIVGWYYWVSQPRSIRIDRVTAVVEHSDPFTVAAFSPDGRYLAVSDFKHNRHVPTEVMVWETDNLQSPSIVFDGPETQCHALCFHPVGRLLAIGGEGGVVKIADVKEQAIVQRFEIQGSRPTPPMGIDLRDVRAMQFSPGGAVLAIATDRREIEIWSTTDWQRVHILPRHSNEINDLAFSADGTELLSVSWRWESIPHTQTMRRRPEIYLWNAESWKKIREIPLSGWTMTAQHVTYVGETLAVVGNNGGELTMIDTSSAKVVDELVGHENMIGDLVYDHWNNLLISTSPEQTIVWDMNCRSKAATARGSVFVAYTSATSLLATAFTYSEKTCVLSRILMDKPYSCGKGARR